jgi:hypothetical protein
LDRGWGRPPQTVAVDPASAQPLTLLHLTAARQFSDALIAERATADYATTIEAEAETSSVQDLMQPAVE